MIDYIIEMGIKQVLLLHISFKFCTLHFRDLKSFDALVLCNSFGDSTTCEAKLLLNDCGLVKYKVKFTLFI